MRRSRLLNILVIVYLPESESSFIWWFICLFYHGNTFCDTSKMINIAINVTSGMLGGALPGGGTSPTSSGPNKM
uniref:Uncharacterized protein n=1 Tax=Trichobilharzia regenti TaxID=157069 RepID=A0AA85IY29_TRIRE|nr:unnamed protein product [Trichobilharzia regenti]